MLTYDQVGDVYPPRGDQRWLAVGEVFYRATYEQVHAVLIDDSQGTIGGAYGGGPCAAMMMLNQASGTKIPGTPWMPPRSRASTGGFFPASHCSINGGSAGTVDRTKYPPGFAAYIVDVNNASAGLGAVIMSDSAKVEKNLDMLCQGQTGLVTKDDTNWYAEALMCGANNAVAFGGTAGNEITINGWRANQTSCYFGGGGGATLTLTSNSSALGLATVGNDDPAAIFRAGPLPFSSDNYISARVTGFSAGRVRVGALRIFHRTQPGWFLHVVSEGGYRVIAASSWYTTHASSGPFYRKMFSIAKNAKPDLAFMGLGTNDIFGASPRTAADYKAEVKTWLDWYFGTIVGGTHPLVIRGEPFRGDTSTPNYATYVLEYNKMAGAIKELIDEGYPGLYFYNGLLMSTQYFGSLAESYLAGKTYLGDFATLVQAVAATAITQNVHYVSQMRGGHYQFFLWTGATTTIGTLGVISSLRHGPGADLDIGAPVSNAPVESWAPMLQLNGRQGNVGPGAPNDFVHLCPSGQQREWEMLVRSLTGACAATRPAPSRTYRR